MLMRPESKMQIIDDLAWEITANAAAERFERLAARRAGMSVWRKAALNAPPLAVGLGAIAAFFWVATIVALLWLGLSLLKGG